VITMDPLMCEEIVKALREFREEIRRTSSEHITGFALDTNRVDHDAACSLVELLPSSPMSNITYEFVPHPPFVRTPKVDVANDAEAVTSATATIAVDDEPFTESAFPPPFVPTSEIQADDDDARFSRTSSDFEASDTCADLALLLEVPPGEVQGPLGMDHHEEGALDAVTLGVSVLHTKFIATCEASFQVALEVLLLRENRKGVCTSAVGVGRQCYTMLGAVKLAPAPELVDALPTLEIATPFPISMDRIDLAKCRERRIRITNTIGIDCVDKDIEVLFLFNSPWPPDFVFSPVVMVEDQEGDPPTGMKIVPVQLLHVAYIAPHHLHPPAPPPPAAAAISEFDVDAPDMCSMKCQSTPSPLMQQRSRDSPPNKEARLEA
jgi:hypothetical protein